MTQEKFLIVDGILVGIGLFVFWLMRGMNKTESHFRDDIWDTSLKGKPLPKDPIDRKILLDYRPDPEKQEHEDTQKIWVHFQPPKFSGKPHEILGISPTAGKEEIQAAFRHWMMRYHPDRVAHLGPEYVEQARKRAEQLNGAREAMLKGR